VNLNLYYEKYYKHFIPDFATVIGYLVVSRPFLNLANPKYVESSHSERLEVSLFFSNRVASRRDRGCG